MYSRVETSGQRITPDYVSVPSKVKLNASEIARTRRMFDALASTKRIQNMKRGEPNRAASSAISEAFIVASTCVERALRGDWLSPNQKAIILERVASWEAGNPIAKQRRGRYNR